MVECGDLSLWAAEVLGVLGLGKRQTGYSALKSGPAGRRIEHL